MNELFILLGGIALGTYYAESIRKPIPILDPNKASGESNAVN